MSLARWRPGAARAGRLGTYLAAGAAAVVVAVSLLYSVAYDRIYTAPHTAVAASRWIYDNVPPRSVIATEHWDEGMPLPLIENGRQTDAGQRGYRTITLNLYDDDNEAKLTHIVQQLDQADYIVMFSNRLYGTIPRLPKRYPMTSEYYRLLFGEKLGYQLVGAFESYPNVLGHHLRRRFAVGARSADARAPCRTTGGVDGRQPRPRRRELQRLRSPEGARLQAYEQADRGGGTSRAAPVSRERYDEFAAERYPDVSVTPLKRQGSGRRYGRRDLPRVVRSERAR
jgi:hypothetical protein